MKQEIKITRAICYNAATKETKVIGGIKTVQGAWDIADIMCSRWGWNVIDFRVRGIEIL